MECNKDEAIRALDIAKRKVTENDYSGAKTFAVKAQNLYPQLDGLKQVLMLIDVYISAGNKINGGQEPDWYGVLGVDPLADDGAVKKQYRKLALLLHPDKNKCEGAEGAFKLVLEAWSLLSDKVKRIAFDQKRRVVMMKEVKPRKSRKQKQEPKEPKQPPTKKQKPPKEPKQPATKQPPKQPKQSAKKQKQPANQQTQPGNQQEPERQQEQPAYQQKQPANQQEQPPKQHDQPSNQQKQPANHQQQPTNQQEQPPKQQEQQEKPQKQPKQPLPSQQEQPPKQHKQDANEQQQPPKQPNQEANEQQQPPMQPKQGANEQQQQPAMQPKQEAKEQQQKPPEQPKQPANQQEQRPNQQKQQPSPQKQQPRQPSYKASRNGRVRSNKPTPKVSTFWTVCNVCETQQAYIRVYYLNKNVKCRSCNVSFKATEIEKTRQATEENTREDKDEEAAAGENANSDFKVEERARKKLKTDGSCRGK
ncbi:Uncharacterized protein HA466_0229620 [Hirschfeldia incana]|nr:Uncharacterized protein HA466_0229620 [Hirschfeldia incana]